MERELFIYFFTDPPRLKRAIAELSARVDAQIVSLKWRMWVSSIINQRWCWSQFQFSKSGVARHKLNLDTWKNDQNHLFSFPELVEVWMEVHILESLEPCPSYKFAVAWAGQISQSLSTSWKYLSCEIKNLCSRWKYIESVKSLEVLTYRIWKSGRLKKHLNSSPEHTCGKFLAGISFRLQEAWQISQGSHTPLKSEFETQNSRSWEFIGPLKNLNIIC